MQGLFHDWHAKNITSVLHEKRGGYANNMASLRGLAKKATALGVEIIDGVTVTGLRSGNGTTAIGAVETSAGTIACDEVVVAVGPWINALWNMLSLPKVISVKGRDGKIHDGVRMWHYMALQEGTLGVDPDYQKTNDGRMPPVLHVDTDAPLHSDRDGHLITDRLWGIYYKPDFHFGGVQGGAMPAVVEREPDEVRVDPYGPKSPEFVVTDNFADMWTSALAFCQKRFEGQHAKYRSEEPSGGIGCFTPDNFPVFDRFRENVYVIADSNHGYKMIGVGELVADELMGDRRALLEPFRFSRYAAGRLHPVSNSPFPWS
jgi:glycine/D-amino acid oxidase-like deaminating enzyme